MGHRWRSLNGEDSVAALQAIVHDHQEARPAGHSNILRTQSYYIQALAASDKRNQALTEMTKPLKTIRTTLGETHILTKECAQQLAEWQQGTA